MKFDDILEHHIGEFGPYQKRIYALTGFPVIAAACMSMLPVFLLAQTDFRCQLPNVSNDTYHVQSAFHKELINLSVPVEEDAYGDLHHSQCRLYDFSNSSDTSQRRPDANTSTKVCDQWVFDTSEHITAISDYKMVCDNAILQSHFKMITFFGGLFGAFLNGILSDMFGRKKVILCCLGLYMIATVILVISPIYMLFLAMRFAQGLTGSGIFMTSFVIVMELVGPHYRMFAGMFVEVFWCVGLFILLGVAYLIRDWTHLTLALSAPWIFLISFIWLLPESPRWLMSRGRIAEAEKILRHTAEVNGTTMPENLMEGVKEEEAKALKQQESGHVWKLFVHRPLMIRTLIVMFNRLVLNICYYGISLNVGHLSGNMYVNFSLSSAVELAAIIVLLLIISKFGRKPLYASSMILAGIGFLLSVVPVFLGDKGDQMYAVGLVMVGKFGTSAGFAVMLVFASELFPTSLRNSAMGLSFVIELMGGVISPYIINIGVQMNNKIGVALPAFVFGALSISSALVTCLLPETRNRPLPETLADAVKFSRHETLPI